MTTKDPLERLVVDGRKVDRGRLAEGLANLVAVDGRTGAPIFHTGYDELTGKKKVLAVILARKAAVLLGKSADEVITPAKISEASGVPNGTVRRSVMELLDARLITQNGTGRYFCASHQLIAGIEYLK